MNDIDVLDRLRRIPEDHSVPNRAVLCFAKTLSSEQRALLAALIREQEEELDESLSLMRECLVPVSALDTDLRQARNVMSRWDDGKLYSRHTQGPDVPTEEMPPGLAERYPHVALAAKPPISWK